ncbi:MAG TPA: helix-turn-helix domain-containing protein [Anaeromyxobacteraceae bacterium]|nr:helix-turn-helix domain-containing protein [Anaeromyxobacteraceae bacterium]
MPDLLTSVILLGAVQGAVLATVLVLRRTDRLANRILAVLVAALSLMLLFGVVERAFPGHPHLLGLGSPLPFLFAPLLYLYVAALTRPIARFEVRWLVHGLPFAAAVLFWLQLFYLRSGSEKLAMVQAYLAGGAPVSLRVVEILQLVQAIAYLLASWVALRRYARKMEGYFSDLARIDLRWLMGMVTAHAAVWSIVLANAVLRAAGFAPASLQGFSQAIQVGSALVVFATGYVSLWQPELFAKAQAARAAESARRTPPKYQRNRLQEEEAEALARKLTGRMADGRLYRDAALTLQALADAVGATPHMVSQVLNVRLGKSFFVFVNSYRTEALMSALADPAQRQRGVLDLALEAGFNSKSTLNSFFKRYTGLTPSEFRVQRSPAKSAVISRG